MVEGEEKKVYKIMGSRFELPKRYEVIDPMGSGAYGVVIAAKDTSETEDNLIAIKKVEKLWEHRTYCQRTLRELKIMRLLQHDNILSAKTILAPDSFDKF
jgi:serine/threonine protein kinase